jgi:hypothetical protein
VEKCKIDDASEREKHFDQGYWHKDMVSTIKSAIQGE